jgi:hypothetical protein
MGRDGFFKWSTTVRLRFPEASMDARLDMLNQAARNGKDFGEFICAVGAVL